MANKTSWTEPIAVGKVFMLRLKPQQVVHSLVLFYSY